MAYGTDEDRNKLMVLAQASDKSQSEWLISMIRTKYAESFGSTDPKCVFIPHP